MTRRVRILNLPGGHGLQWNGGTLWYTRTTTVLWHSHTMFKRLWSRQKIEQLKCETRGP